jgi:hypothetical protein
VFVYFGSRAVAKQKSLDWGGGLSVVQPTGLEPMEFARQLAQSRTALLGWGQTVFEACFLGVPFVAIANEENHMAEAERLGVEAVGIEKFMACENPRGLMQRARRGPPLDTRGGDRTARLILEAWAAAKGSDGD